MTNSDLVALLEQARHYVEVGDDGHIRKDEYEVNLRDGIGDLITALKSGAVVLVPAEPTEQTVGCHDCNRQYGHEHGFPDLVVPNYIWRRISPSGDEGGLLCPSCICKRLHDAGISNVEASFMSGPIQSVTSPTMHALRMAENLKERLDAPCRKAMTNSDLLEEKLPGVTATDLLRRAVRNTRPHDTNDCPRWCAVMDTFSLGSTYAHNLCEIFDLNPNETVRGVARKRA